MIWARRDALTASLITHTVREPLQLWNFGQVVDRVGSCGSAWSAAVNRGQPDGPIRAMSSCGNTAAVSYAQHLDGTNIWVGLVFVVIALMLGAFMVLSGWAVLKVSVKAIYTTVILLPTLWLGAIPGAAQRRATAVVWQFFRHAIEVLVYIVFVSVMGLALESIVAKTGQPPLNLIFLFEGEEEIGSANLKRFLVEQADRLACDAVLSLDSGFPAVGVPGFFRLTRASTISARQVAYVEAARAVGAHDRRILLRHILPNVASPLIVLTTMRLGTLLLAAGALGFIGLGAQPPQPEWGALLAAGRDYMDIAPWLAIFPGVCITLTVVGFNLLGDGLRDALDPRLRYGHRG